MNEGHVAAVSPPMRGSIRVVLRGLSVLRALGEIGPSRPEPLARHLGLPRTTVCRIVRTLLRSGHLEQDPASGDYRLTIECVRLSHGFDAAAELVARLRPVLHAKAQALQWPTTLMTFEWPDMVIRESTDARSPFAVEVLPLGTRVPVLSTASGRAFLAFADAPLRETLLDYLWPRREPGPLETWPDRTAFARELARIRSAGFASAVRPLRVTRQGSIAVPVGRGEDARGVLAVRFALTALPFPEAEARFLPVLREMASTAQRCGDSDLWDIAS